MPQVKPKHPTTPRNADILQPKATAMGHNTPMNLYRYEPPSQLVHQDQYGGPEDALAHRFKDLRI